MTCDCEQRFAKIEYDLKVGAERMCGIQNQLDAMPESQAAKGAREMVREEIEERYGIKPIDPRPNYERAICEATEETLARCKRAGGDSSLTPEDVEDILVQELRRAVSQIKSEMMEGNQRWQ